MIPGNGVEPANKWASEFLNETISNCWILKCLFDSIVDPPIANLQIARDIVQKFEEDYT